MAHIEKCIKDLLTKSGKKPASEHAAVWVPDSEANACMVCQKSQFNLVNRRVSKFKVFFATFFDTLFISASLPKMWICSLWKLFDKKVFIAKPVI